MPSKKIMVFGVFDGLHEGHKFFLKEAKKLGESLAVVIAPDEMVKTIKNKLPRLGLEERFSQIKNSGLADEVVVGDDVLGSWEIIEKLKPDIVVLGYDQKNLSASLKDHLTFKNHSIEIKTLPPFSEDKYKSSLMNQ